MSDSPGTVNVVQRNPHRITDEEQGLYSLSETTPTSSQPGIVVEEKEGRPPPRRKESRSERFLRTGKHTPRTLDSLKALVFSSWLNILLVFIPIAWVAHFSNQNEEDPERTWSYQATFVLCFMAIVPLEKLLDYGGEQLTFYVGPDIGDLLVVTFNNIVEGTLAIILLRKCKLRLLQSTIIGVVLLHLLLVPGVAFVTGGARISEQDLHPHLTQLNQTLLTIGVLTLLLPAAFFAALNRPTQVGEAVADALTNDTARANFLKMSRGLAVILLTVYICSRIFLHNPPGEAKGTNLAEHKLAPEEFKARALELQNADPQLNQWVCIGMLAVTIGIMATTAEWLVDSIDFVEEAGGIGFEWFGLILLPLVSFSGDGFIAILFFLRSTWRYFRGEDIPAATLANAQPIDLSIQFTLFWMPFIVLLGWWLGHPMSLLFDMFEVAMVIAACFIVNYVTADSKTNWAEGWCLLSFYVMIALCTWFYDGQPDVRAMLSCENVLAALAGGSEE
ncbi:hypothetical protein FB45DRAFT_903110 [Roridomyces roridus]|uniref:Sodium/calcium exchanger membrane region domain-containing protein n=1 Tax=Roridomyces roridus TaxID=1738132 RepID=A0AAD7C464_9AGAR|nr:hypothetical protein FB45DRAFT_903110 [Roridomyces roridus]